MLKVKCSLNCNMISIEKQLYIVIYSLIINDYDCKKGDSWYMEPVVSFCF